MPDDFGYSTPMPANPYTPAPFLPGPLSSPVYGTAMPVSPDFWGQNAPLMLGGAGGIGAGLGAGIGALGRMGSMPPASLLSGGAPLPFTSQIGSGYTDLYNSLSKMQASPNDLNRARDFARTAANSRGITGPAAANLEAQSQNNATALFNQWRYPQLQGLLAAMQNAQELEAQRRLQLYQLAQAQYASGMQQNHDLWSTVGGIGGAVLGGIGGIFTTIPTGGLVNPLTLGMAGYSLGTGLGGGIADATYGPAPTY